MNPKRSLLVRVRSGPGTRARDACPVSPPHGSVMQSAVRNRLIAVNPAPAYASPARRTQDADGQIIDRIAFRFDLLPVVPQPYQALVDVAGGAGLRWGEAAGLCADALDLDAAALRAMRSPTTGAVGAPGLRERVVPFWRLSRPDQPEMTPDTTKAPSTCW